MLTETVVEQNTLLQVAIVTTFGHRCGNFKVLAKKVVWAGIRRNFIVILDSSSLSSP